jgi:CheY-like chemotaxis protein
MAQTILVVDDESHIVQVLSLKLSNAGYEVISAGDGEEASELAQKVQPDLIITDFQMPYMTGLELCHALSNSPVTQSIPVIMLTARGYALDDHELDACNIKCVISKPFSPRSVVQEVARHLSGQPETSSAQTDHESEAA